MPSTFGEGACSLCGDTPHEAREGCDGAAACRSITSLLTLGDRAYLWFRFIRDSSPPVRDEQAQAALIWYEQLAIAYYAQAEVSLCP